MGSIEQQWRTSPSRRKALASLAALVASSPLLAAQRDPRPLAEHQRIRGFDEMIDAFDFEPVFFGNVPQAVYDYTAHGADSEFTVRRNRDAFEWVDIVPGGPAVPATTVDTRTTVFGLSLDFPIFVAPSATQVPLHPDGEMGMHRGATAAKTPLIISNASSQPVEEIVSAASGPTWFQFYPRQDLAESRQVLERAQTAGCQAVVVTVDQQATFYERTQRSRNLGGAPRTAPRRAPRAPKNPYRVSDGRLWYEWRYLDDIRPFIKVPMLVKGILTVEDALLCVERGAQGIIVSNHGGRSLDYGPSTLEVLPEIVDALRGRIPVLIDSGFRRGADVMKALALGATAVCFGRATRWALGAFGTPGVQGVLEMVQAELVAAMAAAGRSSLAGLNSAAVKARFS